MATDLRQWLGSILFTTYLFVSAAVYGSLLLVFAVPFGHTATYRWARRWAISVLYLLERLCGLKHVVEGAEHLPSESSVVLVKHSSAWETIAQLTFLPTQTWVLKRELLYVPVFGWVLKRLKPIAIDRGAGRSAVQQVIALGQQRLDEGLWVVIFPEGTRVPAGTTRRYGLSGALLAAASGRPVVPVAHNAGEFWPRRGWLKRPGIVRVIIGPPVATAKRDPREINEQVRAFIDAQLARMAREG